MTRNERPAPSGGQEMEQVNARLRQLVDVDRRVISRKQTIGYMLFDGSTGFNIDGHKDLFTNSVLKIDLSFQSVNNLIGGVWDIVDDFLVSFIIEKTRTRWGKFIPYIFMGGLPYAVIATLFWLLPLMLPAAAVNDFLHVGKFILYILLNMLIELVGNFKGIAVGGYLSTITPYPSDRRRLLAVSGYFSIIYSRLPDLFVEFLLDFIKHGIVKSNLPSDQLIGRSLMIVGAITTVLSGVIISWYTTIARERVHQKIEKPRIRDSLRIVFSHRPVRAYLISNALGSFGTGLSTNDYYRMASEVEVHPADAIYGRTMMLFYEGRGIYNENEEHGDPIMPFIHQSVIVKREHLLTHPFDLSYKILGDREFFYWMRQQKMSFHYEPYIVSTYDAREGGSENNPYIVAVEGDRILGKSSKWRNLRWRMTKAPIQPIKNWAPRKLLNVYFQWKRKNIDWVEKY